MHHTALRRRVWGLTVGPIRPMDIMPCCHPTDPPPHAGQPGHIPFRDSRSLLVYFAIYVLATVH